MRTLEELAQHRLNLRCCCSIMTSYAKHLQMEKEQKEFILSEYKKLIDAYDNNTNKYAAIAAILRALADSESDYIYTADGYEEYKIDAVRSTDIYHIANLLEELK